MAQPSALEQSVPAENASPVDDAADSPSPKSSKKRLLWIAAALLVVAIVIAFRSHKPAPIAGLPDPAPASEVIPVPKRDVKPGTPLPAPVAAPVTAASSGAINLGMVNSSAPGSPPPSRGAEAAVSNQMAPDVVATHVTAEEFKAAHQEQLDRLDALSKDIADIKSKLADLTKPPRRQAAASRTGTKATARRAPEAKRTPDDAAQLLAVDLWGGKPSIVVSRGRGKDADITFLNEGEKQGRVTVKRADVGTQRAILATGKGDVILSKDE